MNFILAGLHYFRVLQRQVLTSRLAFDIGMAGEVTPLDFHGGENYSTGESIKVMITGRKIIYFLVISKRLWQSHSDSFFISLMIDDFRGLALPFINFLSCHQFTKVVPIFSAVMIMMHTVSWRQAGATRIKVSGRLRLMKWSSGSIKRASHVDWRRTATARYRRGRLWHYFFRRRATTMP